MIDDRRVELDRVALDLRHEHVVLDLLDQRVQEDGRDRGVDAGRQGEDHGRIAAMIGPDDRQQLEDAGDHREQDRETPEDGVDVKAQDLESDERRDPDDEPQEHLAAEPLAEHADAEPRRRPGVRPPFGRQRRLGRPGQRRPVLDQVEHPDRHDHVAHDRADDAGDSRHDRQQVAWPDAADALAEVREPAVDRLADRGREVEMGVEVGDLGRERRELPDERATSSASGRTTT
jgi:hypothetical protein